MTRAEAAQLVRTQGGEFVPAVTRHTSLLVVGLEGWPLRKDGRVTRKLLHARRLQQYGYPIAILPEEEMLSQLESEDRAEGIHQLYTNAQLCQILHVPRDRLRTWMSTGLIQPVETANGVCYFDFQQVTRAKTLCDLAQAGVTPKRLRQSLEQLRKWMPNLGDPFSQLAVIEHDGDILVRLEEGQLMEPTGQMQFDFTEVRASIAGEAEPRKLTADEWFVLGCEHENAGRLDEAAQVYREALLQGGTNPDICYNLANVLFALGQKEQAAERFHQVVEIDSGNAGAWNNLGNVLTDLGKPEEAAKAYRRAMEVDPGNVNALYNFADLLDELGRHEEAARHWRAYLRQDPSSSWGKYARQRLFHAKKI